jgi:threonine aldolase
MRQSGILAACGLVALRDMRGRLADDHRRAKELANGLAAKPGFSVVEPDTNLIYVSVPGRAHAFAKKCEEAGVKTIAFNDDMLRFVTHKDIDDADIAKVLAVSLDQE